MKTILVFRRALTAVSLFVAFLIASPNAFATHLRGGNISWKVTASTATTYTVQFTFTESQRWSYPNTAGTCTGTGTVGSTTACAPVGTTVSLTPYSGGTFNFGDGATATPTGTITSINQAQDYATITFTFTHIYNISAGQQTAYFLDTNRISTLKVGHDQPEYISTLVQNYPNGTPVASMPAILSVPLESPTQFNLASAVTDIDPNATLTFRLSTIAEVYGPGVTSVPCPNAAVNYTQGDPPGFTISPAGLVTWNTAAISTAVTGGNCNFGIPKAGDLWAAQVMVEAINKTTSAVISQVPVDILMQFVSPVGALPTITLSPAGTQTVNIGTPIAFTATGNSTNAGTKITLNASGVPAGAVTTGLNATVTPPTSSNFNWTPGPSQAGTYVVTYTVTDSNLQQAQASETLVVATLPEITCSTGISVPFGSSGLLTAKVFDPSNEVLNVVWTVDGSTVQTDNNIVAFPGSAIDSLNQIYGAIGVHPVKATATDPHGVAVSCSTSATVTQADQTIVFPAIAPHTYGDADFDVFAPTSAGLTPIYSAVGNCTILGSSTVHITGAGSCQVTASQPGNDSYNAAPSVTQSFNISPSAVTITGGSGSSTYDGTVQTPSACAVTGIFTGDLTCTNQPATVGPDSGTTAIVPSPSSSNLGSFAITTVNGSFTIAKALSTTTISCPASITYNGTSQAPCTATVTGAGGLSQSVPVNYTDSHGTTSTSGVVNAGIAQASAGFSGDANHQASTSNVSVINVNPALLTVSAGSYSGVYDGGVHALSACTVSANFDSLTCSNNPTGPVGPDVGSAVVAPIVAGPTGNYTVTTNNGAWSITPLSVAVIAGSSTSVFDGNVYAPSACVSTYSGVTCSNNPSSVGPGAGSGTVIPVASVVAGIPSDYTITPQNGSWTIKQAPSVTTVSCPASVVYNGAAQTPCTATVTGGGGLGQPVTVIYTSNVNVGAAQASATFAGDANHTASSNTATFNITPASLSASAGSYSGTYDGNTHALSACVVSANPDGLTCTNNPAGLAGPDVTAFSVTPVLSGSSANYNYHPMNGSVSITPLSVTVTAGSYSGTFDGSAHAPSACASSYPGVICTNSITSVGPATGSGAVAPMASIVTGTAVDYTITPVSGSWSITSAASTTTVTCPASVTYNGAPQTPCTATVTGAGGLSQSVSVTYTSNVNAGAVQASASFAGDANHTASSNTAGFNITPAVLMATAGSYSGVYDGNAHAVSTCVVGSNSDGVSCTNNPASVGPATGSGAVVPVVSFYGNTGANYTIAPQNGSWSITAAPSTTTITCPASVTYNGSAQAPCTATVTGAGGLSQSLSVSYTSNTSAGTATAAATFAGDTNHAGSTNSTTFAISQAPLAITWTPALAPIAYGTPLTTGAAPLNATVIGNVPGTFTYNAVPVGSGTAATIGSATVLSAGVYNLTVTFVPADSMDYKTPVAVTVGTLVVNQVSAGTLSLANVSTNYGVALTSAQLAAKLSGPDAGGQGTTTYSISGTTAGGKAFSEPVTAGTIVPAGAYTISATFTPGGAGCTTCSNFSAVSTTAKLTVAAVPLTITASSLSTVYGSVVPVIASGFAGLVGGDTAASLTTQPVCTTTATSASNAGKYPTSCSGAVDSNYIISYAGGTLTVTPAVLTVAATPLSLTYGGYTGPSQLTYTITGFQLGQTAATDLIGFPIETTNAPSNGTVGDYTITVSGGLLFLRSQYSSDYTIVYQSAPLTITPAVLTVTATSVSYVYGATDSDRCGHVQNHLTYTITGFAYGQNQFTDFYGAPSETTTATPTSNVGTYPITITKGTLTLNSQLASDYTVVFVNGTVTVTPATLTVLANSYSRPINTANPAFGYTVFGFVNGDTQATALTGAPSCCSTTATPASAAGDYAIVIGPGTLAAAHGNYTISYRNGLLVVFNPNSHGDPHNNGHGGYCDNLNWDRNNWPDPTSFSFYWGSGQGPTIKPWGSY